MSLFEPHEAQQDQVKGPAPGSVQCFKLKEGRFKLGIRQKLFTIKVVRTGFPEVVDAPPLEVFTVWMDRGLSNLIQRRM